MKSFIFGISTRLFPPLNKTCFVSTILLIITACSHPLEITGEGDIVSSSGAKNCSLENQPCSNLVVGNYNVSYTAVPRSGWEFLTWENCGTQHPNCAIDIPASIVDQNWGKVMPPLRAVFVPMDSTIVVDGKIWLQPDLFRFLSWNQIVAVCPAGACVDHGTLNGFDMTGWTWASTGDMRSLFNHYLGQEILVGGNDIVFAPAITRMYSDGWRVPIAGHTSSDYDSDGIFSTIARVDDYGSAPNDLWAVNGANAKWGVVNFGAWFYRLPN